jgi:hypothetical protein
VRRVNIITYQLVKEHFKLPEYPKGTWLVCGKDVDVIEGFMIPKGNTKNFKHILSR